VKCADASAVPFGLGDMRDNEGYDILHNGTPRTFRDSKPTAYEAARFAKSQQPADIIEVVDRSAGTKMLMLPDGRTA